MNDDDLMRRISEALDAGGLDRDAGLRAVLAEDPAAAAYATDLEMIGAVLGEMAPRGEPDWDTLLSGLDARLDSDEVLEDIGDPAEPPIFTDLDAAAGEAHEPQVTAAPQPSAPAGSAKVVDLATRRRRTVFASIGGVAAAAAVGLGIMAGLSNSSVVPSGESTAMQAPAQADIFGDTASEPTATSTEEGMENLAVGGVEGRATQASVIGPAQAEVATANEPEPSAASSALDGLRPAARPRRARTSVAREPPADLPRRDMAGGAVASGRASRRGGSGPAPTALAAASPSRAEVVNALNTVAVRVQECMNGREAIARFHLRVDGASGRVVSAAVRPPFRGREARCMVSAVRSVHMPTSVRGSYEVDHAYHPAPVAAGSLTTPPPAARRSRERGGSSSVFGGATERE